MPRLAVKNDKKITFVRSIGSLDHSFRKDPRFPISTQCILITAPNHPPQGMQNAVFSLLPGSIVRDVGASVVTGWALRDANMVRLFGAHHLYWHHYSSHGPWKS
jgi:hypothetical protein